MKNKRERQIRALERHKENLKVLQKLLRDAKDTKNTDMVEAYSVKVKRCKAAIENTEKNLA